MKFETETKDFTRTPPSGFAAHLPFQGRHELGTDCAVSGVFVARKIPLETFHRNVFKTPVQQAGHRAERSCSLRPRKAVAFLTHLLRAPEHGAGNFAVCGQRLRGHVPSKNTSPAALSWSSLIRKALKIIFVLPHVFSIISRRDRLCRVRSAASFPLIPAKPHQKRALHFEVLSQNHMEQRSFYASSCADSRKIVGSYSIWFLS